MAISNWDGRGWDAVLITEIQVSIMNFEKLISKKNLLLAWRRITSSRDARYKAFFRHILEAYELSFDKNIDDLRVRLKNREYIAQTPIRFYIPKPSGLQRPLTLLAIEDQIVLQALANLFAEKVGNKRNKLAGKYIYSNRLGKKDSQFFLEKWQLGFSELKRNLKLKFKVGYAWNATFDISAFYDTIPHELLLNVLASNKNGDLYNNAKTWLKTWSSDKQSDQHSHGIPQGPMASDFLAECILLAIDEKMSEHYAYFRYVDDIRILGKTELEVRQALVYLDILCKSRGLIPNSDKTKIGQIASASELVEGIPDVTAYFYDGVENIPTKKSAEKSILNAIEINGKTKIKDKTLLRYILFRAHKSDDILKIVLKIWEHFPEHTDAYVSFLENYQRNDDVIKLASRLLEANYPYDYVQGELWKLVARMGNNSELNRLTQLAIKTVKSSNSGNASRFGAHVFLCQCDKIGLGNYEKWVMYEKSPIVQAFVAPYLRLHSSSGIDAGKLFLSRSQPDSYLGLVKPLIDANIGLSDFDKDPSKFPVVVQHVYKAAGIAGHIIPRPDAIGNLISKRYSVIKWNKWANLFKSEYRHGHMLLKIADTYFGAHFTSWLSHQDTFNEVLFKVFQEFLASKNAPGAISLVNKNGKPIKFGSLINDPNFKTAYPDLQDSFSKIHRRRNLLPSSHAYDEKTGDKAKPLKKDERDDLKKHLDHAYNEIIKIVVMIDI
ncbi:MAG: RNA-directed DNA polymerase [Chloroflexota bacterium]|nr:RNA-directed DNA polymerase [Chloroflexota bacterium]